MNTNEFDRDYLQTFYEQVQENRRDYVERMWETVKYFTTVITSLITLSIGGAFAILQYGAALPMGANIGARLALSAISLLAAGLSLVGLVNLRRECKNEYMQMAIILTIEKIMGMQKEIPPEKRFFADENFIVPYHLFLPKESFPKDDPQKIKTLNVDNFIAVMMSKKHSFYVYFRRVFQAFILISLSLCITFALWAFAT